MKNRNYCFTLFLNTWNDEYKIIISDKIKSCDFIKYCIYQVECCPQTKRIHLQGYLELNMPCRLAFLKKNIHHSIHVEKRLGTQDQAIEYCKKSESRIDGPYEFGEKAKQGQRNDLKCLSELAYTKVSDFAINHPDIFVKYSNGISKLKQAHDIKMGQSNIRSVQVITLIGEPGCGKTKFVYDNEKIENIYKLNTNSNNTLWFDGYEGQNILLIDDFNGWIKYTELLTILDRYPYRCQIKGGFTYAMWDKVYITSNYDVETWYRNDCNIAAIKRRITQSVTLGQSGGGNTNSTIKLSDYI